MIDELLKVGGARLLAPCIVAVVSVALAKGLFGVHQSKRTSRKDFLDLWSRVDDHDQLWLQTAIRHLFGEWLPTPVIRRLMESTQAGQALREVCGAWDLLEQVDETLAVTWKAVRHRNPVRRLWEIRLFMALYFLLGVGGLMLVLYAIASSQDGLAAILRWLFAVEFLFFAFSCLGHGDNLKGAHKAAPRWLGLA